MIDIDIQISISERSSGWATNYRNACVNYMKHRHRKRKANKNILEKKLTSFMENGGVSPS